ncbi:pyridoxamine 5'-phosphate oxidase family protein [Micromonospora globbae]|uniref:Pyridoxamine 5'-phosphate oxidase n=1 Tax=Micromonospora globbae TaxID=1894969 RepID=A0A420F634_9ACTN|nr:pyridoxamine 5'-phosphate oxidase family protein [Micromonospora globbae]RKF28388.1 pyridoxamine 5'-phosphate oxidase [Micromonospora globbae]WTF84770.1 pyridoxamine 5'-phosphate oxidase family protein [Micromonospora globbae]
MSQDSSIARRRVTELIREARVCLLTTIGVDGRLVSRPMALQEAEFDGDLWFFTHADSAKVRQIRVNPEVGVAFSDGRRPTWVSISGTATEGYDPRRAERWWHPLLATWFPDGPGTPGLTLVKVHVSSVEYWDSPDGGAVSLLGPARAAVTGRPPRPGENREVRY